MLKGQHEKEEQLIQELRIKVERLDKEVHNKTQMAREKSALAQKAIAEGEAKVSNDD